MVKVKYQGIVGSNSEIATKILIERLNNGKKDIELCKLISSKYVCSMLSIDEINFGVMAVNNNIGGIVEETAKSVEKYENISQIDECQIKIHHCLFVKDENISLKSIKYVASHPQALMQTKTTIKNIIDEVKFIELENSAICTK